MKLKTFFFFCLVLSGCSYHDGNYANYLNRHGITLSDPTVILPHCHGYGCQIISEARLNNTEWKKIKKLFKKHQNAERERQSIANAIGVMETIIGAKTGTDVDIYGTFQETGRYQQDCVDESTNTTIYIAALIKKNLIRHHALGAPEVRLPLIHSGSWPHQTAVIIEKETTQAFAVDSWFHDNGLPAEIVTLEEWKNGWRPTRMIKPKIKPLHKVQGEEH